MAVPTLISELSTTAASNPPAGSESSIEGDNHLRAHAAFIAQLNQDKAPKASPAFTGTPTFGTGQVSITGPASATAALTVGDQTTDARIAVAAAGIQMSRGNWLLAGASEIVSADDLAIGTRAVKPIYLYINSLPKFKLDSSGNSIFSVPASAPTLDTNSTVVFNLTSNTNLRISARGSDGTTRTADITLA